MRGKGRDQPRDSCIRGVNPDIRVSVPLRGKGRDQPGGLTQVGPSLARFPSPCGEKVGINKYTKEQIIRAERWFPSPCGEKVGINSGHSGVGAAGADRVSVPLRGKGRDQPQARAFRSLFGRWFPSPCGEKVGINVDAVSESIEKPVAPFPSPCGEKVGINLVKG